MTQPSHDHDPRYDFAERLLNVRMYPEALPPVMPLRLPIPPGSRVIGSVVHAQAGSLEEHLDSGMLYRGECFDIVLATSDTASDVLAFYEPVFAEQDWHRTWPATDAASMRTFHRERYHNAAWQTLTLVFDSERAPGQVHLALDLTLPAPRSPRYPRIFTAIPPLIAPPDGRVHFDDQYGTIGPPYRMITTRFFPHNTFEEVCAKDVVVETHLSAMQLHAHIAEQFHAEGWYRLSSGADSSTAWSRWDVPGSPNRQGWVLIHPGTLPDHLDVSIWVSWPGQLREPPTRPR